MSKNVFELAQRKVIPAVLIYVRQQGKILMIHRDSQRPGDYHSGRWNGLGGKLEVDESPLEAAVRELAEESGLKLPPTKFKSLGVVQFPNFKPKKSEDWMVFIFTAELSSVEEQNCQTECDEGSLHWIPVQEVSALNLWPGDKYFIPFVLNDQPFVGTLWYGADEPSVKKVWISPLT